MAEKNKMVNHLWDQDINRKVLVEGEIFSEQTINGTGNGNSYLHKTNMNLLGATYICVQIIITCFIKNYKVCSKSNVFCVLFRGNQAMCIQNHLMWIE